jgi:hypothetical protein
MRLILLHKPRCGKTPAPFKSKGGRVCQNRQGKKENLFPFECSDALFDGLDVLAQARQVLFEPGDLFLFGPKVRSKAGMLVTAARAATMTAAMVLSTVMAFVSAGAHVITSFLY